MENCPAHLMRGKLEASPDGLWFPRRCFAFSLSIALSKNAVTDWRSFCLVTMCSWNDLKLAEHLHFGQVGLECCSVHLLEKPLHCSDFCSTNSYLGWMLPIWRVDPFLGVRLHWVCLLTKSSWRFTSWFAKAHQAQKRKTVDIFRFHLQKCRLNKVLIEWIYFI